MEESEVKRMIELYKEGKSIDQVAEETGWHRSTVYRKVKDAGINRSQSESAQMKTLSKEHKKKIKKSCQESSDVGRPARKLKQDYDKMDAKLAYIFGVLLTDGYTDGNGIGLETIDKEFCDRFQTICEEKFGLDGRRYNGEERENEIDGKKFTSQETEILRIGSVKIKEYVESLNLIEELSNLEDRELQIEALKGMWDSDGSLNVEGQQVLFYKQDKEVTDLYEYLLDELFDFDYRTTWEKNQCRVCKFGTKDSIREFYEVIDPTIERKREKLEAMIQ